MGGGLIHHNLRAPMNTAKRRQIDTHKVGSICFNIADPRYPITAHLNQNVQRWDL